MQHILDSTNTRLAERNRQRQQLFQQQVARLMGESSNDTVESMEVGEEEGEEKEEEESGTTSNRKQGRPPTLPPDQRYGPRLQLWSPFLLSDLQVFLGTIIVMGISKLSDLRDHW